MNPFPLVATSFLWSLGWAIQDGGYSGVKVAAILKFLT